MDLSLLQQLVPDLAGWLHLPPSTLLLYIILIGTGSNIVSRVIPDDVTGFWGGVRRLATVLGAYVPNRITSGVTTNDVVRQIVTPASNQAIQAAEQPGTLIHEVVDDMANKPVVPAFPGLASAPRDVESEGNMGRQPGEAV